jgi:hypothetical protein
MNGLVHGVGINDLDEYISIKGKHKPYYSAWKAMLGRCYCVSAMLLEK